MNIKIYQDRYTETCNIAGTQYEQNATMIKLDFSELDFLDDECVKTIHFFHDSLEENNYIGDTIIENDEFKIPKTVTEYENVLAFIQITKEDFIWKTKSFNLDFFKSLDVDKTLDEDELGILQELILEVKEIQNITTDKFEEAAEKATEDFNKNATEKLNDFNDNYTDKLNSFNENSNSKVNNYNSNAESKTEDFNTNADNQKSNFDNNVTEKTNTFNSNTESKTTEFNNNATSKTDSFNSNATSKETSYNENATSKLNEYNENHTSKLNDYNENAQDKIEEYDNHIEELDNIVSKNIASGESIYIDDALEYKVFGAKIDGNAEQTTTTGKNLLSKKLNEYSKTTDYITVDEASDNLLKLSVSSESTAYENVQILSITVESGKTYTLSAKIDGNTNSSIRVVKANSGASADNLGSAKNEQPLTFTCDGTYSHVGLFFYVSEGVKPTYNMAATFSNVQLEEGSVATDYEEYTGGEPSPNSDYPQSIETITNSVKIKQTGKNLFDKNTITASYFLKQDGTTHPSTNYCVSDFIPITPNTTYFFPRRGTQRTKFYDKNKTALTSAWDVVDGDVSSTTPENAYYVRISILTTTNGSVEAVDINKFQFEQGSVATEYGEYKSNEYTINLQDNELVKLTDDIKDTIEIDKNRNVSLNKRIGKAVLNGTENWIFNESGTNYIRFTLFINDLINNQENNKKYVASDYFVSSSIDEAVTDSADANRICAVSNQRLLIKLVNDNVMNLDDFKAWLSENNVTVYYELAEPTTTSLAQLTNFKTFEGINHFFLEANISTNFEVTYAQDLQKVISKQQAEIDELKTLLSSTATSALLLDNYESDLINEIESEV